MAEPPPDPLWADPLWAELREVVDAADPVPDNVLDVAKASFVWRTIDAELAELVADSLDAGAGVRAVESSRLLTFRADGVEVEVEVSRVGARRRLTGQLIPVGAAKVTLRWSSGAVEADADKLGRFTIDQAPAGAVSLAVLRPGADHPLVTSWVAI